MGKGKKGAKGKGAGKGKGKGADAAGKGWPRDGHRRSTSPNRDHRGRDRDRDRDRDRRRDGDRNRDRSRVRGEGRDRRQRTPSPEPRKRSDSKKSDAASDGEEAEPHERSDKKKKKKKKKKSGARSDGDEADDDGSEQDTVRRRRSLSLNHRNKCKELPKEASDDGDADLDDNDVYDDNNEFVHEPVKGKKADADSKKEGSPPSPDVKRVLAKAYDGNLSKKFKGNKTKFGEDEDDAGDKSIDVNADEATPDKQSKEAKSRKAALEEKHAQLKKMLDENEKLLASEGLGDVIKSKGSEADKVNQAYLLGQKDANLQRSDSESNQPPKSRESRDLMQLPRPDDVPLGIAPEAWVQLDVKRMLFIRKIAQDPERSQYFDWDNALFSGKAAEVKQNLECLANEPTGNLSGLFNKPEKPVLKKHAKEADSGAALSKSIAKQAQQAGQPPKKGNAADPKQVFSQ